MPMENVKEKKAREKTDGTEAQQKKAEDYYQLIDCPLCALSLLKIEKVKREQEFQNMQGRTIEGIFKSLFTTSKILGENVRVSSFLKY